MKNVDDMSDAELHAELHKRHEERKRSAQAKGHAENAQFLGILRLMGGHAKDLIDILTPEHDTVNCNDNNRASAYIDHNSDLPRCTRCYMLSDALSHSEIDDHIGLVLRFFKRYDP